MNEEFREKPRCLIIHANLLEKGGAELFALRAIKAALKAGFAIDVLHSGGNIDWSEFERWAGFEIEGKDEIRVIEPKASFFDGIFSGDKPSLLAYALSLRTARDRAAEYDFIFSTYGELPLAHKVALQFIHVPLFFYDEESLRYLGHESGSAVKSAVRAAYVLLCRQVAGWSRQRVSKVPALANSIWTKNQALRHYPDIDIQHTYIGANTSEYFDQELGSWWRDRAEQIVILGRVVPGKRLDIAIRLVERLQANGINVGLTIIGSPAGAYQQTIENLIADKPYITWKSGLSRAQLEAAAAQCKWGLHCAPYEHYGLAAIELQRLGCLTLVPDSCGQSELVADDRFKYRSEQELYEKFVAIHSTQELQTRMNEERRKLISLHTFENHDRLMFNEMLKVKACIKT